MNNRWLILLAGMAFANPGRAQHLDYTRYQLLQNGGLVLTNNIENQYAEIKGSAFYSDTWLSAAAVTEKGTRFTNLKLKVDLYKNNVYMIEHDTVYNLTGATMAQFILYPSGGDSAVFRRATHVAGVAPEKFVQVLVSGKLTIYKQLLLEVKDVHDESPLMTTKKFIGQDYYFLSKDNGEAQVVKPGKKMLEQEFGDKWKAAAQYAKEKDLSFNQEQGWVAMLRYYNSL